MIRVIFVSENRINEKVAFLKNNKVTIIIAEHHNLGFGGNETHY